MVPRFVSYALLTDHHKSWIMSQASHGATMASLNQGIIGRISLPRPSLATQRRIAGILSAYDDLIENNERRIAILEDMARRIFREWFVDFRFPGNEAAPMVDTEGGSLPQGWRWQSLGMVCRQGDGIQTGPFGSQLHQSDYSAQGVPVVMPKQLIGLRVIETDIARIPESLADLLGRHRMQRGDIVYGRRGDIGRRAFIAEREDGWFCGTGCLRLRPDLGKVAPRFLFDALALARTDGEIKGRAQGATMPNLSAGVMASVPVMVPSLDLQQQYAQLADIFAQAAATHKNSNAKLAASRDLLLPRLISGALSVEAAERVMEAAQ